MAESPFFVYRYTFVSSDDNNSMKTMGVPREDQPTESQTGEYTPGAEYGSLLGVFTINRQVSATH